MVSEISSRISELDLYGQTTKMQDVTIDKRYVWLIYPLLK